MKKKSALLVSISMVLVAVLALTTASFAWFTASTNPSVEAFDVGVTAAKGLLISAEAGTGFKATVTKKELVKVGTNQLFQVKDTGAFDETKKLQPVTPKTVAKAGTITKETTDGSVKFDVLTEAAKKAGTFVYDEATNAGAATVGESIVDFIKFDIYFQASYPDAAVTAMDVSLDLMSTDAFTKFTAVDASGKALTKTNDTFQRQLDKIIRVAFVPVLEDKVTIRSKTDATLSGATSADNPDVIVFEPNATEAFEEIVGVKPPLAAATDPFTAVGTTKAKLVSTGKVSLTESNKMVAQTANLPLFRLVKGGVAKMTVYIWLEGNDANCVNEVSSARFTSSLKFAGADVTTPIVP